MSDAHDVFRDLVLAFEELTPDERAAAEAHLRGCADCRRLLSRLREIEARAQEAPGLPLESGFDGLTGAHDTEAAASLEALRRRLGLVRPRRRFRAALPLALAAAALLALFLAPRPGPPVPPVRELRLVAAAADRAGGPAATRGVWHMGDAFALEFELPVGGVPIVFHADAAGRLTCLNPEAAGAAPLPAGVHLRLPPDASPEEWVFTGEPGRESFLVVAPPRAPADLSAVTRAAESMLRDESLDREARVERLRRYLAGRLGPVQRIDVDLRP